MRFLAMAILLAPTLWAITDALRRPADRFPTGRRGPWIVILIVAGATPFAFLGPVMYLLTVRLKGGPVKTGLFFTRGATGERGHDQCHT